MAGFNLDDHLTGFVVEDAQPDVIVGQPEVKLGGDGGQHLFWVQGGDGAAGNIVEQLQLAGALLLAREQARIFHRHCHLRGQDGQNVHVPQVKGLFLSEAERPDDSGGLAV